MPSGLFIGMVEIPFDYGCITKNCVGPTIYLFINDVGTLKILHHFYAIIFLHNKNKIVTYFFRKSIFPLNKQNIFKL